MSRHSKVRLPDFVHTVGFTQAVTTVPSVSGPAASRTAVDVETVTYTSASLSRSVMKWVLAPARLLISISCPSTQTGPRRSTYSFVAPTTTRSGCGLSALDSRGMAATIGVAPDTSTAVRRDLVPRLAA